MGHLTSKYEMKVERNEWWSWSPYSTYTPVCRYYEPVLTVAQAEEMMQLFSDTIVTAVEKNLAVGTLKTSFSCPYMSTDLLEARQPKGFSCKDRVRFLALFKLMKKGIDGSSDGYGNIELNKNQFNYVSPLEAEMGLWVEFFAVAGFIAYKALSRWDLKQRKRAEKESRKKYEIIWK